MTTTTIHAYAALEAGAPLEPYAYEAGPLGAREVEIQVESCGICHSDLSVINNEWGISAYPVIPGHEVIGTIGAVGDQVTEFQEGQRVGLGWHSGYISTVNVKLDWNLYLNCLKPKGRLHFVGATLEPLDLQVFGLLTGQRQVSGSPVGSPATISTMLQFCAQHDIRPQIETFPMEKVNEALAHLERGNARYRIVLTR